MAICPNRINAFHKEFLNPLVLVFHLVKLSMHIREATLKVIFYVSHMIFHLPNFFSILLRYIRNMLIAIDIFLLVIHNVNLKILDPSHDHIFYSVHLLFELVEETEPMLILVNQILG